MSDHLKIRREGMRWNLILTLNRARPVTTHERFLLDVMRDLYADATQMEVRRELDYLGDRELIEINKTPSGAWFADLTRHGIDLAEYTVDCEPGIARPQRFWED
jgi:hypothetical protein